MENLALVRYAALISAIVALAVGIATSVQWHRTRYLTAAAELVRSIQTPAFARAIVLLDDVPIGADASVVSTNRKLVRAAYVVSHVFESLGVMVFYRLLPLHLVDHLTGGYVRANWRRLQPYIEERRLSVGTMFGEWFQWLAERMLEDPAPGKALSAPAAHGEWKRLRGRTSRAR